MNCFEFRRRLLVNPHERDPQFLRHKRWCPDCLREVRRLEQLDVQLAAALAVEPPPQFAVHIVQNTAPRRRRWRYSGRWLGLIALSLLLMVGVWIAQRHYQERDWQARAWQMASQRAMTPPPAPFVGTPALLAGWQILPRLAAHIRDWEPVTVAQSQGVYLRFDGDHGPVIALLFPQVPLSRATDATPQGFAGVLQPFGDGRLLLLGKPGEDLAAWAHRLRDGLI